MYGLSFDKINVIIACCDDTYSHYCIKKRNNDHFHPKFALILFNIKSCSFFVVKNDCDFLYWKNLSLVFTPQKPPAIAFILPVLKREQRWQASWIRSVNVFKTVGSLALHPTLNGPVRGGPGGHSLSGPYPMTFSACMALPGVRGHWDMQTVPPR